MAVNIQKLADVRVNENFLSELRNYRHTNFTAWKSRIAEADKLYRGDYSVIFPGETAKSLPPAVQNLVQVEMEDMARLVSESVASVKCIPDSDADTQVKRANVREAIANTYWDYNQGNLLIPKLAMDLIGTGGCFVAVSAVKGHDKYPVFHRIDPRMAYPDTFNGQLQDLLVVQSMKLRQAAILFPKFADWLGSINPMNADEVEVLEYYSKDECVQALSLTKAQKSIKNGVKVVKRWNPEIGCPPVAMAMLDSFDGEFRGMFDQIGSSLNTKNRIVQYLLDYSDRLVYAPKVSKGLLNPEEADGPDAHFRLDPNVPDAQMGRLSPAGSSPQLFALLEYLDREQRGGTSYNAARQGEVSQSIASASFVASTQGALTSAVRNVTRLQGGMRENLNIIAFKLDEKELDFEKELSRPLQKRTVYTPKADIAGRYNNRVIYGAGAGLDRQAADTRVLMHRNAGLISLRKAREQVDYIDDPFEQQEEIDAEIAAQATAQKFLAEAPWQQVAQVTLLMRKGKGFLEAIEEVMGQAAPPAAGPGAPAPGAEGQPGGPLAPLNDQAALNRGGLPPARDVLVG